MQLDLPQPDMSANRLRNVLLASELETRGERDGVLNRLGGPVAGGREVGMSAVANLYDASFRRGPLWLRVSPEQLEIDNRVRRSTFDEVLENGCPLGRSGDLIHSLEHFVRIDGVVPRFRLATSCLLSCQSG